MPNNNRSDFKYEIFVNYFECMPDIHKKVLLPLEREQREEVEYYKKQFLPIDEAILLGSVFDVPQLTVVNVTVMQIAVVCGNTCFLEFILDQLEGKQGLIDKYFFSGALKIAGGTLPAEKLNLTTEAARLNQVGVLRFLREKKLLELDIPTLTKKGAVYLPFHHAVRRQALEAVKFFTEELANDKEFVDPKTGRPLFELSDDNPRCYHPGDNGKHVESILHDAVVHATKNSVLSYILQFGKYEKLATSPKSPFCVACGVNAKNSSNSSDMSTLDILVEHEMHLPHLKDATTIKKLQIRKFDKDDEDEKPLAEIDRELHQVFLKYEALPVAHESLFENDNTPNLDSKDKKQKLIDSYIMTLIKNRTAGNSPLHIAASLNSLPLLKYLTSEKLGFKVDVNGKVTKLQTTPLILAVRGCQDGDISCIKYLVDDLHADIDMCQSDGAGPLYVGTYYSKSEAVRYLLQRNANGSKLFDKRSTPFVGAISAKNLDMVKLLIEMKCDTSTKRLQQTPLEFSRSVNGESHPITKYIAEHA